MSTKIKICGLTNLPDALDATESGADYLGVIFADSSPRVVQKEIAKAIKIGNPAPIPLVGVFQNQSVEFVNTIAHEAQLDFVQLHGEESIEYCQSVERPVIKVINLSRTQSAQQLLQLANLYAPHSSYLMFDKPKGEGKEGWLTHAVAQVSQIESELPPYFFAGGLSCENVESVLAQINPYCLDVASSVEKQPRQKDLEAMRVFCKCASNAHQIKHMTKTGG